MHHAIQLTTKHTFSLNLIQIGMLSLSLLHFHFVYIIIYLSSVKLTLLHIQFTLESVPVTNQFWSIRITFLIHGHTMDLTGARTLAWSRVRRANHCATTPLSAIELLNSFCCGVICFVHFSQDFCHLGTYSFANNNLTTDKVQASFKHITIKHTDLLAADLSQRAKVHRLRLHNVYSFTLQTELEWGSSNNSHNIFISSKASLSKDSELFLIFILCFWLITSLVWHS